MLKRCVKCASAFAFLVARLCNGRRRDRPRKDPRDWQRQKRCTFYHLVFDNRSAFLRTCRSWSVVFAKLGHCTRLAAKQLRFGRHPLTRESDLASSLCRFFYSVCFRWLPNIGGELNRHWHTYCGIDRSIFNEALVNACRSFHNSSWRGDIFVYRLSSGRGHWLRCCARSLHCCNGARFNQLCHPVDKTVAR